MLTGIRKFFRRYQAQYRAVPDKESSNNVTQVLTLPDTFGKWINVQREMWVGGGGESLGS